MRIKDLVRRYSGELKIIAQDGWPYFCHLHCIPGDAWPSSETHDAMEREELEGRMPVILNLKIVELFINQTGTLTAII